MIKHRLLQMPLARKIASVCALSTLACSLILLLASLQGARQLAAQQSDSLGSALSEQLAINSSAALVAGDKLFLQSQLQALIKHPAVVQAGIFDIEHHAVAEALDEQTAIGPAYSASITYQDSIAGYAVITLHNDELDNASRGLGWQLFFLCLLLAGLCYLLALFPGRYASELLERMRLLIRASNYPANTGRAALSYAGQDELQELLQQVLKGPTDVVADSQDHALSCCLLHIEINAEQQAREQLLQRLTALCKLYDGRLEISRPDAVTVPFFQSERDEHSQGFRASCCGHLALLLASQTEQLTLRAAIVEQQGDGDFAKQQGIAAAQEILAANDNCEQLQVARALSRQVCYRGKVDFFELGTENKQLQHSDVDDAANNAEADTQLVDDTTEASLPISLRAEILSPYDSMLKRQLNGLLTQLD